MPDSFFYQKAANAVPMRNGGSSATLAAGNNCLTI